MYGFINTCLKSLVEEKFGEDTWEKLRCLAGVQDHFMTYEVYDDTLTLKLVQEACCMLDVSSEQVLHLFGQYFFGFCKQSGYDTMLRTLGGNLTQFIENLDSLHSYLALSYEEMNAPSFRTERTEDGMMLLHYYSDRKGLYHIVPGIIEEVAKDLFDCSVSMRVVSQCEEDERTGKKEHVVFEVDQKTRRKAAKTTKTTTHSPATAEQEREDREKILIRMKERCLSLPERPAGKRSRWELVRTVVLLGKGKLQSTFTPCYPDKLWLELQAFCNNFPFHIVFDRDLKVKQTGLNVQRFVPGLQTMDITLDQYFTIVHPQVTFTIESIRKFINSQFVLKTRRDMVPLHQQHAMLKLRGQMIWMPSVDCMLYLCSPKLRSLQELQERGLHLADIAQHDTTRDLILLNQQRLAEMELTNQLERKKEELRILSRHLEAEKKKTETLLYAMLPRHVANQLKDGKRVEAGEFEVCTILFSDVVTFTNICAACEPIHIVHMLNCMYSKFDRLTSVHDVYKVLIRNRILIQRAPPAVECPQRVETIGDAYMVVGGVPVPTASHAQRVANFALGMRMASREVTNPVNKQPIQIRVGLHTGPVLAGVVGDKMPRYCLFGDTVNTASRMESHGVPDHIHISPDTYSVLKDTCFDLQERGEIEVKGKGHMTTYFLLGNPLASEESIMGKEGGACLYQEVLQSNEKESQQEERADTVETDGTNGQADRKTPSAARSSPAGTTSPVPFCPSRVVTPYAWDITEPYPSLTGPPNRHSTTFCHLL